MLRQLYEWTLSLAASRHAVWALAVVSFVESSVFPIPPDVLLIPMILADRRRAWYYALVCTVASVAGGFLGYAIGYFAFDTIGEPLLRFYGVTDEYLALQDLYDALGRLAHRHQGRDAHPLQAGHHRQRRLPLRPPHLRRLLVHLARHPLLPDRGAALALRRADPRFIEKRLTLVFSVSVAALVGGFLVVGMVR